MSLLGIDIGTSAVKVVAFDAETGGTLASSHRPYPSAYPAAGRMELDPELVWSAFVASVNEVTSSAAVRRDPVAALALSVSCDEVIPVDGRGRPLGPCIMAPDERGDDVLTQITDRIASESLYARTGLVARPMYPLARILWYRAHEPAIARSAQRYVGWGEFILTRLGLPAVSDSTTAGRWLAYDVATGAWMHELLDDLGVPAGAVPDVVAPGTRIGTVGAAAAAMLGLGGRPVVVAGAHDQVCSAVGTGLRAPGDAAIGSGSWENTTILAEHAPGRVGLSIGATWGAYVLPDLRAVMIMNANGGSAMRWFDELIPSGVSRRSRTADDVPSLAGHAAPEPTDLFFLPSLRRSQGRAGGRASKAAVVGLSLATTREDIERALLEGITFELRIKLEALASEVPIREPVFNTGGGSRSEAWVRLKADVLGFPIALSEAAEPGCLGAAILAALGAGTADSVGTAQEQFCRTAAVIDPDPRRASLYAERLARYRDLDPALSFDGSGT